MNTSKEIKNSYHHFLENNKNNRPMGHKKMALILVILLSFSSCKENNKEQVVIDDTTIHTQEVVTEPAAKKETKSNNALCQLNGEDWAYTKASGIVSTHARTKERTALITFTRKLEKGKESIQLTYDAVSKKLVEVSLILKFPNKEGKLFACYYTLKPETRDRSPEVEMSGTIDLSDPTVVSGNAEITNLNIRYDKELLKNPEDAVVTIAGLHYANVGYSDVDKFVNAYKKKD